MKNYKLLMLLLVMNITFQILSDMTAGKIVDFFGYGVAVTVIYFPFVYIVSDIVAEVYGYTVAKRMSQYTLLACVIEACFVKLMLAVPPASFFGNNDAYNTVFGVAPRIVFAGWLAIYFGDISNNYVLAKMKVWTKGKYLPIRTISSTVVGQFVNTVIFYGIGLSGIIPKNEMFAAILIGSLLKIAVEVLLTPFTCFIIKQVKRIEHEDFFDRKTNFNPFN